MSTDAATQAEELCGRLTRDLQPLQEECRRVEWDAECTGDENAFVRLEELRQAIMQRLSDRTDFETARRFHNEQLPGETGRQVLRWRNALAGNQYDEQTIQRLAAEETALGRQYNSFRAVLDEEPVSDNELDRILAEETDSSRVETAWRASKRISSYRGEGGGSPPVAERLVDLIRLRNQAVGQIGFRNAYEASLELGELDPAWLFETLNLLDRETRPLFTEWKRGLDQKRAQRFGISVDQLRPWHFGDRFFQTPPDEDDDDGLDKWFKEKDIVALTVQSFDELGFDIRPIINRSDLFPGDPKTSKKCQHAFCTTVVAPDDVRVLCNIVPGKRWMGTNLHEFGHAIYGNSLDPQLPYILRDDPHTLTNEAIALLMERHMLDAGWLHRVAGIPQDEAQRLASNGKRQLAIKHLVFTRWVLVMCHFERALYENPDHDDLGGLWWDMVEKYQQVQRPSPDRRDHDWAAKIHFVLAPAYYQNYLLGEVFGAQLQHAVEQECGGFAGNRDAGDFLRDRMFRRGAVLHWQQLLEEITGEPFNTKYFAETLQHAVQ